MTIINLIQFIRHIREVYIITNQYNLHKSFDAREWIDLKNVYLSLKTNN